MEEKYVHLWKHLSNEQRDALVCRILEFGRIDLLKIWVKDGLELNPFMLSSLVLCCPNAEVDTIISLVASLQRISADLRKWLQDYLSEDEMVTLLKQLPELILLDFPSDDFCAKHQFWDILKERNNYKLLAKYQPETIFSYTNDYPYKYLLQEHPEYLDRVFKAGHYSSIFVLEDGWKYLIDHGQVSLVLDNLCNFRAFDGLAEEIIAYCVNAGFVNELYDHKCYEELYCRGLISVFVRKNSLYKPFLLKYPKEANWETLWNSHETERTYLLKVASEVLSDNSDCSNVRYFLKKHSKWRWLMSFFR